mmetsp:Transcript_41832/g.40182  ORF Transcript_41832/g.40182 Transcript_41832/m.40182 type:complete len:241 (+) Transcript_41832:317-1039(+)
MREVQEEFQLNIAFDTEICLVRRSDETGLYELTDRAGKVWKCKYLVVATGWTAEKIPSFIRGVEGVQTYGDHDMNRDRYKHKSVLIIGKGNSGFETADYLIPVAAKIHVTSPTPLSLAWYSRYVGHVRAVNNNFFDTYLLKSGNTIFNLQIHEIKRVGDHFEVYMSKPNKKEHERFQNVNSYDEIISCAGFVFDNAIYDQALKQDLCSKGKFPLMHENFESKKNPNMFFAGTITHVLDAY